LTRLLNEQRVSVVLLPPSALAALDSAQCSGLELVAVCGEPFTIDLVNRWSPGRRFINLYGPTEATMFASVAECVAGERPHIGRPIANTRLFVLDQHRQPVPIGIPGELYIGGACLAKGYLNRPELTAEKFIADPFDNGLTARLYRTGDLVRYLPTGNLEFLGRLDYQVKIRGFRVELGEIEAALSRHPAVRHAVVVAHDEMEARRLVAYLVFTPGTPPATSELRRFLKTELPDYMIPASFMKLDALPLTANGKIDRQALPPPDRTRPELEHAYVAPQTELERRLEAEWRELLQVKAVGIDDNFFDLGGHSLLIIKLQERLASALGTNLSIVELFQYPTIRSLASHLRDAQTDSRSLQQVRDRAVKQKQAMGKRRRADADQRPVP
jgi:acyl-coenzyme A synthetase/AMP-(fatty) acid ligase